MTSRRESNEAKVYVKEQLVKIYGTVSIEDMAKRFGLSHNGIQRYLKELKVEGRLPAGKRRA